jgi:hypothetical protein
MRFLEDRTYAGQPNEAATIDTTVHNGGAVTVRVDGQQQPADTVFTLAAVLGDERTLEISLSGATGASCVVRISEVDGGTDGDLLLCQISDPAPVHLYRFITTGAAAIAALTRAVAPAVPAGAVAAAPGAGGLAARPAAPPPAPSAGRGAAKAARPPKPGRRTDGKSTSEAPGRGVAKGAGKDAGTATRAAASRRRMVKRRAR